MLQAGVLANRVAGPETGLTFWVWGLHAHHTATHTGALSTNHPQLKQQPCSEEVSNAAGPRRQQLPPAQFVRPWADLYPMSHDRTALDRTCHETQHPRTGIASIGQRWSDSPQLQSSFHSLPAANSSVVNCYPALKQEACRLKCSPASQQ